MVMLHRSKTWKMKFGTCSLVFKMEMLRKETLSTISRRGSWLKPEMIHGFRWRRGLIMLRREWSLRQISPVNFYRGTTLLDYTCVLFSGTVHSIRLGIIWRNNRCPCWLILWCCSGEWLKREFKPYNFNALGQPTEGGHLHPLLKVPLVVTTSFHVIFTC